jgi:hypothetical protein
MSGNLLGPYESSSRTASLSHFRHNQFSEEAILKQHEPVMTISGQDSFHMALDEIFSGIDLCLAQGLFSPTLLLVFSCMDAFSWIELSAIQNAKARFEAWVNKRVLPHQEVICSAVDLYAARSGMLHRLGTRSRLSESGEAAQISFCHGDARFEALRAVSDLYSEKTGKPMPVVKLEALVVALRKGVDSFLKDIESDLQLKAKMEKYWEGEQAFRFPA